MTPILMEEFNPIDWMNIYIYIYIWVISKSRSWVFIGCEMTQLDVISPWWMNETTIKEFHGILNQNKFHVWNIICEFSTYEWLNFHGYFMKFFSLWKFLQISFMKFYLWFLIGGMGLRTHFNSIIHHNLWPGNPYHLVHVNSSWS